ncbi:NAD-dependent epimerase/dehydratase family protein [Limnospira fusiformis PMC 851.14]|uniref:NAD-dependent epimerase/dehydratase family protein n=4 Tax=Sirenicapillariaceae TaxID=2934961 RepID=A0ABU9EH82_LIMFS
MFYKIDGAKIMIKPQAVIIGAGGFIGTNLELFLVRKGFRVISVSRSWLNTKQISSLTRITADIVYSRVFEKIVDGADFVFHLAHGTTPASSMKDLHSDLLGSVPPSLSLMESCASADAKLIFLSSGGTIYGIPSEIPTKENSVLQPISGYGISKLVIEKYLNLFSFHKNLRYSILRLANPYGPWQTGIHGQGVIGSWVKQAIQDQPIQIWGNGETVRDYIYIEDVLNAIWSVIQYNGPSDVFNIGYGVGYDLNQIMSMLGQQLGKDVKHEYVLARSVDIPISVLDISKAINVLSWKPTTSLKNGLSLTYDW